LPEAVQREEVLARRAPARLDPDQDRNSGDDEDHIRVSGDDVACRRQSRLQVRGPLITMDAALAVNVLIAVVFMFNLFQTAMGGGTWMVLAVGLILLLLFYVPPAVFMLVGTVHLRSLRGRGLVIAGAIMAFLVAAMLAAAALVMLFAIVRSVGRAMQPPLLAYLNGLLYLAGTLLNVLAGTWALVVLADPQVKYAFAGFRGRPPTAAASGSVVGSTHGTLRLPVYVTGAIGTVLGLIAFVVCLAVANNPGAQGVGIAGVKPAPRPRQQGAFKKDLPPGPPQQAPVQAPPKEPDVPRPAFGDALAQRVSLHSGRFEVHSRLGNSDPLDPKTQKPAKLFLIELHANRVYFMDMTRPEGGIIPWLRVEDVAGGVATAGPAQASDFNSSRFVFQAPRTTTYRLVAGARAGFEGRFTLTLRDLEDGDQLPNGVSMPTHDVPGQALTLAKTLKPHMAAVIAPDCKRAWIAYPQAELELYSCPDFVRQRTYRLSSRCYQLAVDRRGILYAVVEVEPIPKNAQWWQAPRPAHLHVYDTEKLSQDGGTLVPDKVIPLHSVIQNLHVSPDGAWLFFLDPLKRKVGRINLKQRELDGENDQVAAGSNSLCLTPNGKALFVCSDANLVQQLEPANLQVVKTIALNCGQPNAIQACDNGILFLREADNRHATTIYLVNANRAGKDVRQVVRWSVLPRFSSIRLSPDQKHLYVYCYASPRILESLYISDRPGVFLGKRCASINLDHEVSHGRIEISRDGSFLFCDQGAILLLGR
jgi:hypothetical protein